VRPRISGHDSSTWHRHVNDSSDPVAAILIGEALYGMTLAVTELGADRFGRCADETCRGAFFDGTANHSKRFCCSRCATRTNVAAYRQRRAPSE
jgi:predicted RNA-binding Zn ribbon-like protein